MIWSVVVVKGMSVDGNNTMPSTTLVVGGSFTECKQAGGSATVSYSSKVGYYNLEAQEWYPVAVQPANHTLPSFKRVSMIVLPPDQSTLYLIGHDGADTSFACMSPLTLDSTGLLSSVDWSTMVCAQCILLSVS